MANQFGIDMGQHYRDVESIKGARQQRRTNALAVDWEKEDRQAARQRAQTLNSLRGRVAAGGEDARAAERELIAFDPEEAQQVQTAFQNMDERQRKVTEENIEFMGRSSAFILAAETPEEAAQRYEQVRGSMPEDIAGKMPEQFDPNWVQMSLARAREMDDMLQNPEVLTQGGEDIMYRDGREISRTPSNALLRAEAGGSGEGGLKSADESLMFRQAAELLGGVFDQQGNLQNLDPQNRSKVQAIATEASRLFKTGNVTRAQAVTQAARSMGISVQDLQQGGNIDRNELLQRYSE